MSRTLYIKPTRRKHGSGWRMFECGYIDEMDGRRVSKKTVICQHADHIFNGFDAFSNPAFKVAEINMDLTDDGYIRIRTHAKGRELAWDPEGFGGLSDMKIGYKEEK